MTIKGKLKGILLGTALGGLTLSSCGRSNASSEAEDSKAELVQDDSKKDDTTVMDNSSLKKMIDSLKVKYGYDPEYDYGGEKENQARKAERELYELECSNHKWYELRNKVDDEISKIGAIYAKKISQFLDKYGLEMDEDMKTSLSEEDLPDGVVFSNEMGDEIIENSNGENSVDSEIVLYPDYSFLEKLNKMLDDSTYGSERKEGIKSGVFASYTQMKKDQNKARLRIEKGYAKYYPVLNLPQEYKQYLKNSGVCGVIYENEGDPCLSYDCLQSNLVLQRSVSVYDRNLPVDFFGEEGARYELTSVGKDEWKVTRTDADKKTKSFVFKDGVSYSYYMYGTDEDVPSNSFEFSPGDNMGVRVSATEVVWSAKGQDDRLYTYEEMEKKKEPLTLVIEDWRAGYEKNEQATQRARAEAPVILQNMQGGKVR